MAQPLTLLEATESLVTWAYTDSRVEIPKPDMCEALQIDHETAGRYPSEEECETLITGGGEGEVPQELRDLFPKVDELIASFW